MAPAVEETMLRSRAKFTRLLPLVLLSLVASPAWGAYREACWAQYRYSEGWSQTFAIKCDYASGLEMSRIFRSRRYLNYKDYVILRFDVHPVIVRIHQPSGCGEMAVSGCVSNGGNFLTGRDEFGRLLHGREVKREWAIC